MASGGRRAGAGRKPDENSARSERTGYKLDALPPEGYAGQIPDFPLPSQSPRERELWEWAWRTPQACAWSLPSEAWRIQWVADWVRLKVRTEQPDAPVGLLSAVHRHAEVIGLTTAGLAAMGWKIAADAAPTPTGPTPTAKRPSSRAKLTVVQGERAG